MCISSSSIARCDPVGRGAARWSAVPRPLRRTPLAAPLSAPPAGLLARSMALRTTLNSIARIAQRPAGPMRAGCRGAQSAPVGSPPCAGPAPAAPCRCPARARPACRARSPERAEALRVTCCPPERAPCPPCLPSQPLNCASRKLTSRDPDSLRDSKKSCIPKETVERCGQACGNENDRVERRLAAEERARREHYELEAAQRAARECSREPPPAAYCLGAERECARATDGRQYAVRCGPRPVPACGRGRRPPPPQCVQLLADDNCKMRGAQHVDPCAHRPRTILQIHRSQANTLAVMKSDDEPAVTVAKQPCDKKCDEKSCEIKRSKPPPAPPCRQPSVTDTLRARGAKPKEQSGPPQARSLHTSPRNIQRNHGSVLKTRKNQFCTNKLVSSSSPNIKIITFNRATSPLVKQMSANNWTGNIKSGSWASFEKLRKICKGLGSSKKNEKCLNMSSTCKRQPPCGPPTESTKAEAQRVPPNPCAPKPKSKKQKQPSKPGASKNSTTNPCARKNPNPCTQKTQNPCAQKTKNSQNKPNSPCAQKKPNPPCVKQKPNPVAQKTQNTCGKKIPNSPCAQKEPKQSSSLKSPPPCQPCGTPKR